MAEKQKKNMSTVMVEQEVNCPKCRKLINLELEKKDNLERGVEIACPYCNKNVTFHKGDIKGLICTYHIPFSSIEGKICKFPLSPGTGLMFGLGQDGRSLEFIKNFKSNEDMKKFEDAAVDIAKLRDWPLYTFKCAQCETFWPINEIYNATVIPDLNSGYITGFLCPFCCKFKGFKNIFNS